MNTEIDVNEQVELLQTSTSTAQKNAACSKLIARFNTSLYFFIKKMVNSQEDTEDLLQDTWVKAFKKIRQYKPDNAFSTWLFTIAKNTVIDAKRKKTIDALSLDEKMPNQFDDGADATYATAIPDNGFQPDILLQRATRKEFCHELIGSLKSDLQRTLITMRELKQMTYDEIAGELQMPVGTVKGEIFRARKKLQQAAEELNLQDIL
jgi:RNA polymerase sigma factor (sigma-70 family)